MVEFFILFYYFLNWIFLELDKMFYFYLIHMKSLSCPNKNLVIDWCLDQQERVISLI
jgi:hypothetical protein